MKEILEQIRKKVLGNNGENETEQQKRTERIQQLKTELQERKGYYLLHVGQASQIKKEIRTLEKEAKAFENKKKTIGSLILLVGLILITAIVGIVFGGGNKTTSGVQAESSPHIATSVVVTSKDYSHDSSEQEESLAQEVAVKNETESDSSGNEEEQQNISTQETSSTSEIEISSMDYEVESSSIEESVIEAVEVESSIVESTVIDEVVVPAETSVVEEESIVVEETTIVEESSVIEESSTMENIDYEEESQESVTVQGLYATPEGKKYHFNPNCGGGYNGTLAPITWAEAEARGLAPCKTCAQ